MIAWRAAMATGFPSADQFLESIDSDEWTELLAFYELDPFGEQRADIRHARLMAMTAAVHGDRRAKPFDYLPFPLEEKPIEKEEVVVAGLEAMFGALRGRNDR
jgi:hypothetical protein